MVAKERNGNMLLMETFFHSSLPLYHAELKALILAMSITDGRWWKNVEWSLDAQVIVKKNKAFEEPLRWDGLKSLFFV